MSDILASSCKRGYLWGLLQILSPSHLCFHVAAIKIENAYENHRVMHLYSGGDNLSDKLFDLNV